MPAKRKLNDGRADEDGRSSSVKKRKRTNMDDTELMQELYDTIRNYKTESGHLLCEAFVRAPKRRTDPEYYNLVSHPIDLIKIQHKLKSDEYRSLDSFVNDVETLVENAKIYYRPDTQEYQDACDLWELFIESKTVLLGEELTEYETDSGEEEEEDEEEGQFEDGEKRKEKKESVDSGRVKVTNPSSEISSIVIPGTGSTPTIKLKMASSPPAGQARDVTSKMDTAQATAEGGETVKKSHDEENAPKEAEPIRSLRERRYTYRDFLFPKVVISEKQEQLTKQAAAAAATTDKEMEVDEDKPGVSCDEDDTSYEELFAAVVTAKDGERYISDMFKVLPSRKKYPDYYDVIQDPIDLKTIAQKIQGNEYKCLDEMVKDLNQMIHNAKSFNETGSQIYRDAVTLKKIVANKKHELDQLHNSQHPVRSERIRTRKANVGQRLSLVIAAMDSDSDKEDTNEIQSHGDVEDVDSGTEASAAESEEDSLWILYRTVKGQKNSLNQRISEPFLRLPSRRVYPDYYEEIKKPMSLLKIQKKLKSGQYTDLDHLAADLDLVFENAKRYNMDESKLYKDAVRLQGIMHAKLKELKEKDDIPTHSQADTTLSVSEIPSFDQRESINELEEEAGNTNEELPRTPQNNDNNLSTGADGQQKDQCETCAPSTQGDESVIESSHSSTNLTSPRSSTPNATCSTMNQLPVSTQSLAEEAINKSPADNNAEDAEADAVDSVAASSISEVRSDESCSTTMADNKIRTMASVSLSTPQSKSVFSQPQVLNSYPQSNLAMQQMSVNLRGLPMNIQRPAIGQVPFNIAGFGVGIANPLTKVHIPVAPLPTPFSHPRLPVLLHPPLLGSQIRLPTGLPLQIPVSPVVSNVINKPNNATVVSTKDSTESVSLSTATGKSASNSTDSATESKDTNSSLSESNPAAPVSSTSNSEATNSLLLPATGHTVAQKDGASVSLTASLPSSICSVTVAEPLSNKEETVFDNTTSLSDHHSCSNNSVSVDSDPEPKPCPLNPIPSVVCSESRSDLPQKAEEHTSTSSTLSSCASKSGNLDDSNGSLNTTSNEVVPMCVDSENKFDANFEVTESQQKSSAALSESQPSEVADIEIANSCSRQTDHSSNDVSDTKCTSVDNLVTQASSVANSCDSLKSFSIHLEVSTDSSVSDIVTQMNSTSTTCDSITVPEISHSPTPSSGTEISSSHSPAFAINTVQTSIDSQAPENMQTHSSSHSSTSDSIPAQIQSTTGNALRSPDTAGSSKPASSRHADSQPQMCHGSVSLTSQSVPLNSRPAISQGVAMSVESASRSHFPASQLKGFPLGYVKPRTQLPAAVQSPYRGLQVAPVAQVPSSLQLPVSGYRHPAHMNVVQQQILVNQAGQLVNASGLPVMPMSYQQHPALPVAQPQFTLGGGAGVLTRLQIGTSQPMIHIPTSQSYQAAVRQQGMMRQQYMAVAGHMPPNLAGLPTSTMAQTVMAPTRYLMTGQQLAAGYPQMMYSPQPISQSQLIGSPLQLTANRLGVQMMPHMSSVGALNMPVVLTQPPQPRMRFS